MLTEEEEALFDVGQEERSIKYRVLVIYDIVEDKRRNKFVKFVSGFGFRVQKSAFEGKLDKLLYRRLLEGIPLRITSEDNVRVYKLSNNGEVMSWGGVNDVSLEDVIIM
ncbi:CRISPR-associated endonuclease Cas2 [[Clostridium] polysaccharolyticum]|jgi:CRISPR-associated protein Cas2|uniref:CRISPR-associated endoribonuclease Cas2 n=1 Tax=[Clostridium] polysaccharolyticum TaxID=29364 RepID=A0A1I0AVG0_9FIRM|nr:CRISPR-associated endonuclease Cas2 [[Clostridium] polysaccharolyticum]SES98352.1 CRISPR-associated protein, Cas2 family [[Clostridium] polysaccharolyticum]